MKSRLAIYMNLGRRILVFTKTSKIYVMGLARDGWGKLKDNPWTISVITLLLLQAAPSHAQVQVEQANTDTESVVVEAAAGKAAENLLRPVALSKKDWDLTRAYFDVFSILSKENSCSSFYGGPRTATTVLNRFVTLVRPGSLVREVTFQMKGRPRLVHDGPSNTSYRLFDNSVVNVDGAFYQRREDLPRKFPADVGTFRPGTRPARALILLHELGHLIQGHDGDWLLPDDGNDDRRSRANTVRVQAACRAQLAGLK